MEHNKKEEDQLCIINKNGQSYKDLINGRESFFQSYMQIREINLQSGGAAAIATGSRSHEQVSQVIAVKPPT